MRSKEGSLLLEACLSLMIVTILVLVVQSSYQVLENSNQVIDNRLLEMQQESELALSAMQRCDEECIEEEEEEDSLSSMD